MEEEVSRDDEPKKLGDKVKIDCHQIKRKYAAYQKKKNSEKPTKSTEACEAMTSGVQKMAETLGSKPSSLERLSVPTWDGTRK